LEIWVLAHSCKEALWVGPALGKGSGSARSLDDLIQAIKTNGETVTIELLPDGGPYDPELPVEHPGRMVKLNFIAGNQSLVMVGNELPDKFAIREFASSCHPTMRVKFESIYKLGQYFIFTAVSE
jgi:hypothetical protein